MTLRLPVVVIVGRPNVGKSTLFNALVGRRVSIVEEWAGVTRDRVTGEVRRDGTAFELVDTGGVGIVDRDDLSDEVETQIWMAAREADVVLFVVDARAGLTPEDRRVADLLRALDRPVVLAANKVDHAGLETHTLEFHALGLGEPHGLSALEGYGVSDLVAALGESLPAMETPAEKGEGIRIAVVGRRNAGKSTLVNALCGAERMIVSPVPGTTRDSVDVPFRMGGRDYVLVDTAGLRKRTKVEDSVEFFSQVRTHSALRRAHVALLLVDSSQEIGEVDKKIAGFAVEHHVPTIIVLSKWDLAKERGLTLVGYEKYIKENLPNLGFAPLAALSAKDGVNLKPTLELAARLHEQAGVRVGTGELNRAVEELTTQHTVPHKGTIGGKIYFASQVGVHPPRFVFMVNKPSVFHVRYRRFVEGFLRERFAFHEVPLAVVWRERKSFFEE